MYRLRTMVTKKYYVGIIGGSVVLLSGIFALVLTSDLPAQDDPIPTADTITKPSPREPLHISFFQETEVGQTLWAWLGCEDDCEDDLKAVSRLGSPAVPVLIQILQYGITDSGNILDIGNDGGHSPVAGVRERTIGALGHLRDERGVDPLIAILTGPQGNSGGTRASVAVALGEIGGDRAFAALLPLLKDKDSFVREATSLSLARLGRTDAIPALRSAAQAESEAHVRRALEQAISSLE